MIAVWSSPAAGLGNTAARWVKRTRGGRWRHQPRRSTRIASTGARPGARRSARTRRMPGDPRCARPQQSSPRTTLFALVVPSGRTDRDPSAARPAVPSRPDPEPSVRTRRNTTRRRSSSSPASNPRGCSRTSSARPPPMAPGKRATRTPRAGSWSPRRCPRRRAGGTGCSRSSGTRTSRCTRSRSAGWCTPRWSPPTSPGRCSAS